MHTHTYIHTKIKLPSKSFHLWKLSSICYLTKYNMLKENQTEVVFTELS